MRTQDEQYAERLVTAGSAWWKRVLDVQAPYRWNLRRLNPGFTLDLGCGIGRNLLHLKGHGVGIDHNARSIQIAKSRGLDAFTPDEFERSPFYEAGRFDSLLLAHVAEHMTEEEAAALLRTYLHLVRSGGQVIVITPQESGFRSDPTHVQFMDFEAVGRILRGLEMTSVRGYSFPFPRIFGRIFRHNEFVSVSRKVAV